MKPCRICGRPDNRIQIRTGSGLCCNQCEKAENGELKGQSLLDYLWSINTTESLEEYYRVKFALDKGDPNA